MYSQVSKKQYNIHFTQDMTYFGAFTPWKATIIPREDPNKFLFISIIWTFPLGIAFFTSIYFPFFFLFSFYYLKITCFLNWTLLVRTRSSFLQNHSPYRHEVLLIMSYLRLVELILTCINLYLCSIIFSNLLDSIIHVVCSAYLRWQVLVHTLLPLAPNKLLWDLMFFCYGHSLILLVFISSLIGLTYN